MKLAVHAPGRLVVRTAPVADPGDLLSRLPHPTALAWVRHGDGLVGWGETARLELPAGPGRFEAADAWLREMFGSAEVDDPLRLPGTGPVAFGSFGFDPRSADSVLIVPRFVLGRRDGHAWVTTIGDPADGPLDSPFDTPAGARTGADGLPPLPADASAPTGPGRLTWSDGARSAPSWARAVETATSRIRSGDLGKVVLARDLIATASRPIDARVLLHRLASRYPTCYTFAVDGLVGATPELLIRRAGDRVDSLVLAGTTARGATPADDDERTERLFRSGKDREEHSYAVDMVRDALAPLCTDLDVPAEPELLRLPNVTHLASPVHGRLAADRTVLDVLASLHPTPAVAGTPTDRALDLIRELEGMDRGRYAGPVGWVDARGDGEWGIALRCAEVSGTRARLFAGCGIVADSDPAAELAEARNKFRAMQYALEG